MADVKIRVQLGKYWLEVDANGIKDAFEAISPYAEILTEPCCGKCKSTNVRPSHRIEKNYHFYEMVCSDCGSKLEFGQHQSGETLFAKRKLPDGSWDTEHRGWYHWKDRQQNSGQQSNSGGF